MERSPQVQDGNRPDIILNDETFFIPVTLPVISALTIIGWLLI